MVSTSGLSDAKFNVFFRLMFLTNDKVIISLRKIRFDKRINVFDSRKAKCDERDKYRNKLDGKNDETLIKRHISSITFPRGKCGETGFCFCGTASTVLRMCTREDIRYGYVEEKSSIEEASQV